MSENCSICLSNLSKDKLKLDCGHTFHEACISEYFITCIKNNQDATCPLCRKVIDTKSGYFSDLYNWSKIL